MEKPWYRESNSDGENLEARMAYEALMTITLKKPDDEKYKNFSKEVKAKAKQEFGEFDYGEEEVREFYFSCGPKCFGPTSLVFKKHIFYKSLILK